MEKTKYELHTIRLIKVYDKTKGWYIKTLPNKTKADNLGEKCIHIQIAFMVY